MIASVTVVARRLNSASITSRSRQQFLVFEAISSRAAAGKGIFGDGQPARAGWGWSDEPEPLGVAGRQSWKSELSTHSWISPAAVRFSPTR